MPARNGTAMAVWVVSVLLAIVFLLAGVTKLFGVNIGYEAAAMHGFPDWIRIVTGVVEILGAVALLMRPVSAFAAIALALLMIPAYVTQRLSGQSGIIVPIIVFLALLFVAWGREPERVRHSYRSFVEPPHPLLRNGTIAGLIGATCIAVLFFIVDVAAGRPLFTPNILGQALVSLFAPNVSGGHEASFVIVYTIFHYAAFIAVGLLAAAVVQVAHREPSLLVGFVVLFAWLEIWFYGMVALLSQATPLGAFAWYDVMIGNLIAVVAMGAYLWRAHGSVAEDFRHGLEPEETRRAHVAAPNG